MTQALLAKQATTPAVAPAEAYADALPPWLNYLIAAYPTAKLAANTFAVLEDAFSDEDPAVLRDAVRRAVKESRFFPSAAELAVHVRRESERAAVAQYHIPDYLHYRRVSQFWPTCPNCGERINPDWSICPACADLDRMENIQ